MTNVRSVLASVPPVQADWIRTQFPNATTNVQNNLRLGAGSSSVSRSHDKPSKASVLYPRSGRRRGQRVRYLGPLVGLQVSVSEEVQSQGLAKV